MPPPPHGEEQEKAEAFSVRIELSVWFILVLPQRRARSGSSLFSPEASSVWFILVLPQRRLRSGSSLFSPRGELGLVHPYSPPEASSVWFILILPPEASLGLVHPCSPQRRDPVWFILVLPPEGEYPSERSERGGGGLDIRPVDANRGDYVDGDCRVLWRLVPGAWCLAGPHPRRRIQPDRLAVDQRVLKQVLGEGGELGGTAETLGENVDLSE